MQYLLVIYEEEANQATRTPEDMGQMIAEYTSFTEGIIASGAHIGGNALQPSSTATSVRVRNGETLLTDGPFAETREALGGYYLVEAENLDAAVKIASEIPTAKYGTIEVRPVMHWGP